MRKTVGSLCACRLPAFSNYAPSTHFVVFPSIDNNIQNLFADNVQEIQEI